MDKLIIKGNAKISGSVNVQGSKNAALPIIVSSLLSDKILKLFASIKSPVNIAVESFHFL